MRPVCHSREIIKSQKSKSQLGEEPEEKQKDPGPEVESVDSEKKKEEEKPAHLDLDEIVSYQENSQNGGDCSGSSDHGNVKSHSAGMADGQLSQSGGDPPAEVEKEKPPMPENALHDFSEKPKEKHIEDKMHYPAMKEHVGDELMRPGGSSYQPVSREYRPAAGTG